MSSQWRAICIIAILSFVSTNGHEIFTNLGTTGNITVTTLENGVALQDQIAGSGQNYYSLDLTSSVNDTLLTMLLTHGSPDLQLFASPNTQPTSASYAVTAVVFNDTASLSIPLPSKTVWYFLVVNTDTAQVNISIKATSSVVCANNCSGNGVCGAKGICACDAEWTLADCSLHLITASADQTVTSFALPSTWTFVNITAPTDPPEPGQQLKIVFLEIPQPINLILGLGYMPNALSYTAHYTVSDLINNDTGDRRRAQIKRVGDQSYSNEIDIPQPIASLPIFIGLQAATDANSTFQVSLSIDYVCPNDCSGRGSCGDDGCECDYPFVNNDCSVYDEELMNNVTTSIALANGTWAYFHIVVTDANQIIYDVQYSPANDTTQRALKERGAISYGRLSTGISLSPSPTLALPSDDPSVSNTTILIFARAGAPPTALKYTYTSYGSGPELRLTINLPPLTSGVATWWLGVLATGGDAIINVTGVSLRECANECSGNGLCQSGTCVCQPPFVLNDCSGVDMILYSDQPVSGHVMADQLVFYHLTVLGDDALFVQIDSTDGGEGDVILLLRKNSYPSSVSFDYRNASQSTTVSLLVPSTTAAGVWFIGVLGSPRLGIQYQSASFHIFATVGCKSYNGCTSCIQDPNCGWCVKNGISSSYGVCTSGTSAGPAFTSTCDAWLFDTCSTKANQKKTNFTGLILGTLIGGISMVAILIFGFVFYLQWHHQYKLAYRPQAQPAPPVLIPQ